MRGLLFSIAIFLFTAFTPLVAQEGMEGLRYGKLENGLTYYVKPFQGRTGTGEFLPVTERGVYLGGGSRERVGAFSGTHGL